MEKNIDIKTVNPRSCSSLVLAYMGDAIYEAYVRNYLIGENPNSKVNDLHKKAIKYVKAKAQATAVLGLESEMTEEELAVVKRGRNHKSNSVPKNADVTEYKYATGFEALIGYLHLNGNNDRVEKFIQKAIKIIEGMN